MKTPSDASLRTLAQKKADRARSWDAACSWAMFLAPFFILGAFFGIAWYRLVGP